MPSRSPTPNTSHEVLVVQAILSFRTQPVAKKDMTKSAKKSAAPAKGKVETKTKEMKFTFESSEENYLSFLSALLKVHGHDKYTPVKKHSRFGIKVSVAKKAKKDAVDIDKFVEYETFTKKILEEGPSKLTVYLNLDDVKAGFKRRDEGDSSSDNNSSDDADSDNGKGGIERELGRIRGALEKKYANPADSGYTFIMNDGEKVPLTPSMMSEWARAIYDMETTVNHPPNSLSFDPKTRARSLFQTPKGGSSGAEGVLQTFSTILSDARAILTANVTQATMPANTAANPPSTPMPTISTSPAKNTPTKLLRFLQYVKEHEGIQDAPMFEDALAEKGYGPDVIMMDEIDKNDLISCGLTAGDAVRLKRAARTWWTSPDAKRSRQRSPSPIVRNDDRVRIRFEKRFADDGGSDSVFGPGMVPGRNFRAKEFTWWFYNSRTSRLEKVPDGLIPDVDPEYLDPNAPVYEPTPSPKPAAATVTPTDQ